jgi:hypothetical protein
MKIATQALSQFSAILPCTLLKADWQDPVLVLRGDDWTFSVMTPWRVVGGGGLQFGSDDVEPITVAELLNGNQIIECRPQSTLGPVDPAFVFASGHSLEVFSVGPVEPWVLRLGDVGVFVASPTEP